MNDPPQSFEKSNITRFSNRNPFDFIVFDTHLKQLYCLELKTTKFKSISFENINLDDKQPKKMIHKHQIEGLTKVSTYSNVISGFLFNFRDEKNNCERTYFQNIKDFNKMCVKINKKSLNEMDVVFNGGIKIQGTKKRTHYIWNIDEFFNNMGV